MNNTVTITLYYNNSNDQMRSITMRPSQVNVERLTQAFKVSIEIYNTLGAVENKILYKFPFDLYQESHLNIPVAEWIFIENNR